MAAGAQACRPAEPGMSWQGTMDDDANTVRVSELKAQIERATYQVDVDAVAEAFIARTAALRAALRRADVRSVVGDAALREIQPTV